MEKKVYVYRNEANYEFIKNILPLLKKYKVKAKDLLAQAICHELDHLEGEVFIDKIIPGTLEYVEPEK